MSPVFPARRRAEEFAALVEDPSARAGDTRSQELARFLEVVESLRTAPQVQPRAEFVSSLRERLMAAADTELVPVPREEQRLTLPVRRPRDRRIAAAVGGLAIVGATTSMAVAAQSALPGDTLYPLKRAIENVQTGISVDEGERGVSLLATAEGRLEEIESLRREGRLDEPDIAADTFNTFSDQAIQASDLLLSEYATTGERDLITQLQVFTRDSLDTLAELEAVIPEEARDELLRAAMVLQTIDLEAGKACPDCVTGVLEVPAVLQAATKALGTIAEQTQKGLLPSASETKGDRGEKGREGQAHTGTDDVPADGPDLGDVLPQPAEGQGEQPKGPKNDDGSSDPVGDLTGTLTNGDQQTAGNEGELGLPAVDEVVDEVLEPVLGTGEKAGKD